MQRQETPNFEQADSGTEIEVVQEDDRIEIEIGIENENKGEMKANNLKFMSVCRTSHV